MKQMFGVSAGGLSYIRTANNGGKRQRYGVGRWDEVSQAITLAVDIELTSGRKVSAYTNLA